MGCSEQAGDAAHCWRETDERSPRPQLSEIQEINARLRMCPGGGPADTYHNSNQPFPGSPLIILLSLDPDLNTFGERFGKKLARRQFFIKYPICSGCDYACLTRWLSQSNKGKILSKEKKKIILKKKKKKKKKKKS